MNSLCLYLQLPTKSFLGATLVETTREHTRSNLIATNNVTCQRAEAPAERDHLPSPEGLVQIGKDIEFSEGVNLLGASFWPDSSTF